MEHVAIDLGGKESQICVRSAEGAVVLEKRVPTKELKAFLRNSKTKGRVILETCAEAFAIADAALENGHQVRVVPGTLVRSLGVGARKMKSDRRDAQVLSQVSSRIDLPSVHIPSMRAREWRAMCGTRDSMVEARTKLVNNVRGWLRGQVLRLEGRSTKTFPQRVRECFAKKGKTPLPKYEERVLASIEELTKQIVEATKEIAETTETNEVCKRLMTVPGVGPVTALRFVATLDEVERFSDAHALESYLGLTPGEDSSSMRVRLTSITKAGPTAMRWLLVQSAWTIWRTRPTDPIAIWATKLAERRGKRIAVVAVARKLAGILYAMWRDGSDYKPSKGSAMRAPKTYRLKTDA
jgi:transposase